MYMHTHIHTYIHTYIHINAAAMLSTNDLKKLKSESHRATRDGIKVKNLLTACQLLPSFLTSALLIIFKSPIRGRGPNEYGDGNGKPHVDICIRKVDSVP